jgi:hypothetical protein
MRIARLLAVSGAASALMFTAALPVAADGRTPGLMPTQAFAAPAASASAASTSPAAARHAGDSRIQAIHVKNAKNVAGGPSRKKVTCTVVWGRGGSPTLGKVCFQPHGDKFWVKDRRSDGMHIVMRAMPSGNPQTIWDCRDYKGKAASWTVCGFSKKMKENRKINFNALAYKGNTMKYAGWTATVKS